MEVRVTVSPELARATTVNGAIPRLAEDGGPEITVMVCEPLPTVKLRLTGEAEA
jgi:hypothetical protein